MPSNKISRWTFFINFFYIYIDGSQLDNLMVSLIMCSSIGWIMQTSKNLFPLILMLVTIWQKKWFIHLFHHMVYICKVGIHFSYGTYLVINNSYPLKIFSKIFISCRIVSVRNATCYRYFMEFNTYQVKECQNSHYGHNRTNDIENSCRPFDWCHIQELS